MQLRAEPSKDHQDQISIIATYQSSMVGNAPKEPQSVTCGGIGCAGLYNPRAIPWCTRTSAKPEESPDWSLA
jgi:hypothetical protein